MNKTILSTGASLCAILASSAAIASPGTQAAPNSPGAAPQTTAEPQATTTPTSADVGPSDQQEGIADIVVTAERRSETVQRSSLSIEVLSGNQLADVTRPQDLTAVSPSVQVGTSGPTPQVFIRGVGDAAQNSRSQSAVAFNVDGVYIARTTQVGPLMFDISRLEILKGPQGTLYGRNASGGAVNVITNNPRLGEVSGFVAGEVGNLDLQSASAALNIPVGRNAALRVAGQVIDRSGYTSNGGQDQKLWAGRAKFLWEPTDRLSLLVSGDISHIGGQGSGVVVKDGLGTPTTFSPWRDITDTPLAYPFLFGPLTAPYTTPNDRFLRSDTKGISAEMNLDLGFATLTVIPAHRYQHQRYASYTSNFRFYEDLGDKETTLEARLGHDSKALKWVAGIYRFTEESDLQYSSFNASRRAGTQLLLKPSAWAGFAQATVTVVPRLRVIGGVRYTEEKIGGRYQQGDSALPAVPFTTTSPVVTVADRTFRRTNFKVGAEFDVGPQSMLYGTYATGFKGGGFSLTISCGADNFEPEDIRAITLGSRNRFANNRVQLNVEAFQWKYKAQQAQFIGLDQCGVNTLLTRNVGNSTIRGISTDLTIKPTNSDSLRVAVEYNHARYDSFLLTQFGIGAYAASGGSLCQSSATGGGFFNINCSGLPLPRTPKWAGTVSYDHTFDLGGSGEVRAGAEMVFASGRWLSLEYVPNGRDNAYQLLNAQIEYKPAGGKFSIAAYMNNITDTAVYTGGGSVATLAPNGFRYFAANIMPPRTYGVRARFDF